MMIKNKEKRDKFIKFCKEMVFVIIGCFLMAFAIAQFLVQNQLSTGGFTGIATILYYLADIPLSLTIICLNIPLLVLAVFKLGKGFVCKAIFGIVLLSTFLTILENVDPLTEEKFLACIYGGIIEGIGIALVLKGSASTGGTDLVTTLIRKSRPELSSSSIILVFDGLVVLMNVIFFKTIEIGLYSAIAIYLESKMVDIIFEGTNFSKVMFIVSDKNEEIAKEIHNIVQRGTTGLYGRGMYTNEEKTVLMCVSSRNEIIEIRKIIETMDKHAFITIMNARDVYGKGFKEHAKLLKK